MASVGVLVSSVAAPDVLEEIIVGRDRAYRAPGEARLLAAIPAGLLDQVGEAFLEPEPEPFGQAQLRAIRAAGQASFRVAVEDRTSRTSAAGQVLRHRRQIDVLAGEDGADQEEPIHRASTGGVDDHRVGVLVKPAADLSQRGLDRLRGADHPGVRAHQLGTAAQQVIGTVRGAGSPAGGGVQQLERRGDYRDCGLFVHVIADWRLGTARRDVLGGAGGADLAGVQRRPAGTVDAVGAGSLADREESLQVRLPPLVDG